MKISIVCVGKLKERYFTDAVAEYIKRLGAFCKPEIIEVEDEKTPDNASAALEAKIRQTEGERILKKIRDKAFVVALAIEGKQLSSEELAAFIEKTGVEGTGHIVFVIGGSLGLAPEVLSRADFLLSFSKMTFPHQLMRVILLEQIYRGFKISANQPYHK